MSKVPSILILAKCADKKSARKLRDVLAEKYNKSASWWGVSRYLDNEYQLTGFQPIISLGGPMANKITEQMTDSLNTVESNDSYEISTGFNKACIWGKETADTTEKAVDSFIKTHLDTFIKDLKSPF